MVRLHTPRLVLRPWEVDDEPVLRRLLADAEIRRFLGGPVREPDLTRRVREEEAGRDGSCAVVRSGIVVGWVRVESRGAEHELSWLLLPEHVGHGYAVEAAGGLMDWCRQGPQPHRFTAMTQQGNVRSHRVARRLGMRHVDDVQRFGQPQVVHALDVPPSPVDLDRVLSAVDAWAGRTPGVLAVALVGSFARGRARPGSDVDLVVVLDDPEGWLRDASWVSPLGPWSSYRDTDHGLVQSRHVHHVDGSKVEFGLTSREWVSLPLDVGTAAVVRAGLEVVHDPRGWLAQVRASVDEPG